MRHCTNYGGWSVSSSTERSTGRCRRVMRNVTLEWRDGEVGYMRYRGMNYIDELEEAKAEGERMTEKERIVWKALRTWFVDEQTSASVVAEAIDYLLAEEPDKPAPLNAPPPDDMPCWVWESNGSRYLWKAHGGQPTWHRWQPCFVPLGAAPGSVWILWEDGPVSSMDFGYQPDAYDRENSRYIYTVEGAKP